MSETPPIGTWTLKRMGRSRSASEQPSSWRTPSSAERLVVRADGTFTRHLGAGARNGTWKLSGPILTMQESGFDPAHVALGEGALYWREQDEEHGGTLVLEYATEPSFSLDDAAARLKKTKDPGKLIAREGWVQRALREGNAELLALCLRNKAGVYPDTLRDLDACPAASLPGIIAALLAEPMHRATLLSYLPQASLATVRAVFAASGEATTSLANSVALAMAKAPNGRSVEVFEVVCAAASTLDLRDEAGVPLLFHVVLSAPAAWVTIVIRRADPRITLERPARLLSEATSFEAPAGIDVVKAAALCAEAVDALPNKEPWRVASVSNIREKAAMVPQG